MPVTAGHAGVWLNGPKMQTWEETVLNFNQKRAFIWADEKNNNNTKVKSETTTKLRIGYDNYETLTKL